MRWPEAQLGPSPSPSGPTSSVWSVTNESAGPPVAARKRHAILAEEVEAHRQRYYFATPTISDGEFDTLLRELEAIEDEYPSLRTPDSPTQKVGARGRRARPGRGVVAAGRTPREVAEPRQRVQRRRPVRLGRAGRARGRHRSRGTCASSRSTGSRSTSSTATDGLASPGHPAATDSTGEDVTYNAQFVDAIPSGWRPAETYPPPALLEVRGEVVFPTAAFEAINAERADLGLPLFANAA